MSSIAATIKVNTALAKFLVAIIEHTEEIFDSAPVRQETDYIERIIFHSTFEFCQKMIHSIFDSILLYPRFSSKYVSFHFISILLIQLKFNSIVRESLILVKKCSKNRQKKGDSSSKMANINSKYDSFILFTIKFNSKDFSISTFSGIFN